MFAKRIKRAVSFVLSLFLLFQGSAPYSLILAQEAAEMPEWQTIDGVDVTTQPVGENHTYRYHDTAVTVTFTKVTQPGLLKIKEVAVGDATGYDITSDMPDGTFTYDLTLPNPNPSQDTKVQYSEDGQTYQELPAEKQNNTFVIKDLNHFTIFVVRSDTPTNDGTSTTNDASGGSVCIVDIGSNTCYQTIQAAVDAASPGDTINIADGTYTDPVTIDKSNLTLSCQSNTDTIISTGDTNTGISLLSGADDVTIQNCQISGNGDGISLFETDGVVIQNNTISNNTYATSGVHIQDSTGVVITDNSFSGNVLDISNDSVADVDATGNDWGTFDGQAINDRIYDQLDDEDLGLVRYDSGLPAVDAGPDVTTNTSFDQTSSTSDTYGIASTEWSQTSGPGTAFFSPFSADVDGTYVLRLAATDYQGNSNFDEFTLIWDTTAPTDPTPISTSHTVGQWSSDRTIDVSWSGAFDDLSGVDGYYTEWNRLVDSLLNAATKEYEEDASSETSPNRSTAQDHYFHIATLNNAGNWTTTAHLGPFWIDVTPPTVSWVTPTAGQTVSGNVDLLVSASDATSGVATTAFSYQRQDGVDTFHSTTSPWNTTSLPLGSYTLRVIVTDNAGNSTTLDEAVEVAAIISGQAGSTPVFGQIIISWTTDRLTSGRIVYDTVSHPILGAVPNYGYAFSTDTIDTSPKSTSHTITLSGLSDNTVYYWRTVSAGSPAAVGNEMNSRTFSIPSGGSGGGGGSSGGRGTVLAAVTQTAVEETVELVPEVASPTPVPTPAPQVKGTRTFNWWIVIIPAALLGLIISGLLLYRRP